MCVKSQAEARPRCHVSGQQARHAAHAKTRGVRRRACRVSQSRWAGHATHRGRPCRSAAGTAPRAKRDGIETGPKRTNRIERDTTPGPGAPLPTGSPAGRLCSDEPEPTRRPPRASRRLQTGAILRHGVPARGRAHASGPGRREGRAFRFALPTPAYSRSLPLLILPISSAPTERPYTSAPSATHVQTFPRQARSFGTGPRRGEASVARAGSNPCLRLRPPGGALSAPRFRPRLNGP